MSKEMLINTVAGQECRIAIVLDGKLQELYVERTANASRVGNIYKGKVVNIEPSIQAAFIDFGLSKHGFLHVSDLQPKYFAKSKDNSTEKVGRKRPHHQRPPIQQCLTRGQEFVVQMSKEGIGTKGPTMTTYLSIPGRLLVMMPGMARLGVSRKVEDEQVRERARQILNELKLPANMGFILRTAGIGKSKRDLQRDLNYLNRLWEKIKKAIDKSETPAEIYQESDLVSRTIRDLYNTDIGRIICDDEAVALRVREFLHVAMPRTKHRIDVYVGDEGLFHDYGLEDEIERIYSRRVELPGGGSIVIDQTEAMVAIDVNSGRFREHSDPETSALKLNQMAAVEIARQLRLKDLGGMIMIDFVDMREHKNRRAVELALREALKYDRAKNKVLRISRFGIVEMTRQRIGPSLRDSIYQQCDHCGGTGLIKSQESQALAVLRCLQRATSNKEVARVEVTVTPSVAHHLANYQRREISALEARARKTVVIHADDTLSGDEMRVRCTNARGSEVAWQPTAEAKDRKPQVEAISVERLGERKAEAAKAEVAKIAAEPTAKPRRAKRRTRGKKKQVEEQIIPSPKPPAEDHKEPKKHRRSYRKNSRRSKRAKSPKS